MQLQKDFLKVIRFVFTNNKTNTAVFQLRGDNFIIKFSVDSSIIENVHEVMKNHCCDSFCSFGGENALSEIKVTFDINDVAEDEDEPSLGGLADFIITIPTSDGNTVPYFNNPIRRIEHGLKEAKYLYLNVEKPPKVFTDNPNLTFEKQY